MTSVHPAINAVRSRARTVGRRAVRQARPHAARSVDRLRAAVPQPLRDRVSRRLLRHPGERTIALDRLLLGAQTGLTAREFAAQTGQLLWPSTRLVDGPHVALLRLAEDRAELSDAEILGSGYGELAMACLQANGRYFWAETEARIPDVARAFLARYRGERTQLRRAQQSSAEDPILVAPVKRSSYYQVLDGHHRLAIAAARGHATAAATVKRLPVSTPLQDLLTRMSWLEGTRELYQPLAAPELTDEWVPVRRCTDRLEAMLSFLGSRNLLPPGASSYLDIASCYGWFVAQMEQRGYRANGMERDPLAEPLGRAAYGLAAGAVEVGDCESLLAAAGRRWDVVSCFSLLHHFVLGRGSIPAEELIARVDAVTGRVLFLDTGQEHESWFRKSLAGWNAATIADYLRQHTTFDEILDLGPDRDGDGPYAGNYGRHLLACVRTGT